MLVSWAVKCDVCNLYGCSFRPILVNGRYSHAFPFGRFRGCIKHTKIYSSQKQFKSTKIKLCRTCQTASYAPDLSTYLLYIKCTFLQVYIYLNIILHMCNMHSVTTHTVHTLLRLGRLLNKTSHALLGQRCLMPHSVPAVQFNTAQSLKSAHSCTPLTTVSYEQYFRTLSYMHYFIIFSYMHYFITLSYMHSIFYYFELYHCMHYFTILSYMHYFIVLSHMHYLLLF